MFKPMWSFLVALSVVLGLVAALLAIAGTGATVQIVGVTGLVLLVLLLLRIASPRSSGVALGIDVALQLSDRGKTAQSRATISYVPLRAGISHQVWHASPAAITKVSCELQGIQVPVSELAVDGSCIVNFGSQLRRLRRYEIKRRATYRENQFAADTEFFYFRVQAPTGRLVVQIEFPSNSAVGSVSRSVRVGIDHLDRGPQTVENGTAKWTIWFPSVGNEYWIRWTWN